MIRIGRLPHKYGPANMLGLVLGTVTFFAVSQGLWPLSFPHFDQHLVGWIALRANAFDPRFFPDIANRYSTYLAAIPTGVLYWPLPARFDIAAVLATVVTIAITLVTGKGFPDTRIIAGRQLYEGRASHRYLKSISDDEIEVSGHGLKLHPSFKWHISRDRETRHFFLMGSVGGGKTQIIMPLILAAINRGDKLVIYDNKGDFTSSLNTPFVLLAPWDARSDAWDVAKDCVNAQDARELAARLIPEGTDPMWHMSARQVLTAVVMKLQSEQRQGWTWRDLHNLACSSQVNLLNIVQIYQPEARHLLEAEGKTTQGVLINFSASMAIVSDLAAGWGSAPPERRFAFSEWLKDEHPKRTVVIIQGSGRYPELMRGYVQSAITVLAGRINSPEIGESKTRRLWLVLDEFPQLGKLNGVASILEVGRSKGVCVVLGAQDLAQVQDIYGQFVGRTWGSLVGTQIIVRVNAGETAQFIAKEVIGYATIEKRILHEGQPQVAQTQQQLVLEPSDLSDYLGNDKKGVRALMLGMHDANILTWPFTAIKKIREATVPAAWLNISSESIQPPQSQPKESLMSPQFENSLKPRLKLRLPTPAEIMEMAETGTQIEEAGEPLSDMTSDLPGDKQ